MIVALIARLAASPAARTTLRHGATALAILLFLLSLRRAGERTGRMAERLGSRCLTHFGAGNAMILTATKN